MKGVLSILACLVLFSCSQQKSIRNGEDKTARLVNNQRFTFTARTVLPSGGRVVQLNSTYDLRVTKDSVISYLPYFGRAYSAPIGTSNPGIQFTSTSFEYNKQETKKGGWLITIKPRDAQDIQQLYLNISLGGSASLQVTSNNRQAISYNGYID